jgi:hypothetical protein
MIVCDHCNNYEHLACRGHLHAPSGDHVCYVCRDGSQSTNNRVYVFYYNYVTKFSALFPVFIVTVSQEKIARPFA